ncbi:MAG: hypothetical protein HC902_04670 [Calothrix sp. SM1_5_4]|nr:hypothetical protein [Calothrix sp. SM1_5_4]
MTSFLNTFIHHPARPSTRYGLIPDVEKFEGGGCVTLAAVLLKKAGQLDTVIPKFFRRLTAARYLMGGNLDPVPYTLPPDLPWLKGVRRFVHPNLVLNENWEDAPADFPGHVSLRLIDPEKWCTR